ncbi:MAG: hypothetical protein KC502_19085 [Myxococcales bacterium]|nr:hypothetical protein [Myxococcales bacterium]
MAQVVAYCRYELNECIGRPGVAVRRTDHMQGTVALARGVSSVHHAHEIHPHRGAAVATKQTQMSQLDGRMNARSIVIASCTVLLPFSAVVWAMSLLF